MNKQLFDEFVNSCDTLRIYRENFLVFHSKKDKLSPLLEFLSTIHNTGKDLVVFDKIFGNAAALLAIMAGCSEAYGPLGSQIAIDTFTKYSVKYYFRDVVPYILNASTKIMCPMEAESINRTPHEFYQLLQVT